jgi:hypothetical protein
MNAHKVNPVVRVNLGGEERTLCYTLWAALQVEKLTGKNLLTGQLDSASPRDLILLIWAGLLDGMPQFDGDVDSDGKPDASISAAIKQVGTWVNLANLGEIGVGVRKAINAASGDSKESSEKK